MSNVTALWLPAWAKVNLTMPRALRAASWLGLCALALSLALPLHAAAPDAGVRSEPLTSSIHQNAPAEPPFWETWWFRGLTLGVLAGLAFVAFQWRTLAIREQNRRLEAMVQQRTLELQQEVEQRKRAEAALAERAASELHQAEQRFSVMFENSAVGMGILSPERRLVQVNPAVCRMLGYSADELLGQNPAIVVHPDDVAADAHLFRELLDGQRESYAVERRYRRKDGSLFWGRLNYSMVRHPDGTPRYIFGTLENIDEQKQALQELRESEERFRAAFESSAIGMGLLSLDGRVLRANAAVCAISGYTEAELQQRLDRDNLYPADRDVDAELSRQLLAGERDSYQAEKRYVRKNGEVIWTRLTLSLVRDANGQPAYLLGMLEDIDAQKRTLAELRASEARFQAIFDNAAVGIAVMSLERRPLAFNPVTERIIGYSFKELEGTDPRQLAVPEDRPMDTELFNELVAGQRNSYVMERRYRRKDGRIFWARINYSLVRDLEGRPDYLIGILEDIDDQKRALEELRASEARFRALFESASVGVSLMGLDRRVFSVNQAGQRITGYDQNELQQIITSDLAIEEDRELGRELFEELLAGRREQYTIEKRYRRKDGAVFWGRVNFSAVRDSEGRVQYLIGLIEDITESKQANERLAAQEAEHRRQLEQRIVERTRELNQANQLLQQKAAQEAVTSERTRLARDLHDAVTQTLFSATLIADVLPDIWQMNPTEGVRRLDELRALTRGALAEMRTLLVELRPNALTEIPLSVLLRQLTEAVIGRARLNLQLSAEGEQRLPPDVQIALYRIAQEALNNVVKHARASQAFVTLRLGPLVRLTIADNGAGFDPGGVPADHLGLRIMRERAESVGAKLAIYSERGEGTQISVTWEAKE
jgi:PAS domain S-box-containing protein